MFTERAQAIVERARQHAFSRDQAEIDLVAVVFAVLHAGQGGMLLADCLGATGDGLGRRIPGPPQWLACPEPLAVSAAAHGLLTAARDLAQEFPDLQTPGLMDVRHLAAAVAASPEACALLGVKPASRETVARCLASWPARGGLTTALADLADRVRRMQAELLEQVFGQDPAVQAFVEGFFQAELVAVGDPQRLGPRALFVLAGPAGAGRSFLAERCAAHLGRPCLRLALGGHGEAVQEGLLVGRPRERDGARAGRLTDFVSQHADAVVILEDVEDVGGGAVALLAQLLDTGSLADRFTEQPVAFGETLVVLTTRVGRRLYDDPGGSGVHRVHANFRRRALLEALEREMNLATGEPAFPRLLYARAATGIPVLFNRLRVCDLAQVMRAEMARVAGQFLRTAGKRVSFDALVPLAVLLAEGAGAGVSPLRCRAEAFVKAELHAFGRLLKASRAEEMLEPVDEIRFMLEPPAADAGDGVARLLRPQGPFRVLVVAPEATGELLRQALPEFEWHCVIDGEAAGASLLQRDVDLVLLDMRLGSPSTAPGHELRVGQEALRLLRGRFPSLPVYLFSQGRSGEGVDSAGSVEDEILAACLRGGGARGLVATSLAHLPGTGLAPERDRLAADLAEICASLVQEAAVEAMERRRQVLAFETVPRVVNGAVEVRLRGLHLERSLSDQDAAELLDGVERPGVRFTDVLGAGMASAELAPVVEALRWAGRHGLPGGVPRSVLLHGAPGTGKTLLARAFAGEAEVPLVAASATTLAASRTVRDLFACARRHAPSVLFIDDLDALAAPGWDEDAVRALLGEMDELASAAPSAAVVMLAAVRMAPMPEAGADGRGAGSIFEALLRRFASRVRVEFPDRATREAFLTLRLGRSPQCAVTPDLVRLVAERSPGATLADLDGMLGLAARAAAQADGVLSDRLLEEAFHAHCLRGTRIASQEEIIRSACHEAGHVLMYWLAGWWPTHVTVVAQEEGGGTMGRCPEEKGAQRSRTRPQVLAEIRTWLGGRAAELVYYGNDDGLGTGAADDLAQATRLARAMVCRFGMVEEYGVLATPELMEAPAAMGSPMTQAVHAEAAKILKNQMAETAHLMRMYQDRLDAVAQALAHRERITREEVQALLGPRYATGNELRGEVGR